MAKKPLILTRTDIILGADAATIQAALEARMQIDELLAARTAAYQQIAELEQNIEGAIGEEGMFNFPPPPLPVAGWSKLEPAARPKPPKPKPEKVEPEPETDLDELPPDEEIYEED